MTMLDPKERSARGTKAQAELTGAPLTEPATLFECSLRDFVYAEVWTREGLDMRARFLVSLGSGACANDAAACLAYARGALKGGHLTVAELREAALHIAVYGGWTAGSTLDRAVTGASKELGLAGVQTAPIRAEPWDPSERHATGTASFEKVMVFKGPPPQTAYFDVGIVSFVFAEMWNRPGLDERSRRWLTLVGVGFSSAVTPIGSHVWSAMASGNATKAEMFEFVLQYAIHAGWPRGSVMQRAVIEQSARVENGQSYEG